MTPDEKFQRDVLDDTAISAFIALTCKYASTRGRIENVLRLTYVRGWLACSKGVLTASDKEIVERAKKEITSESA